MNTFKVGLLLAGVTALLASVGYFVGRMVGGGSGATLGLILMLGVSVVMTWVSFWYSDKIVLKITKAEPLTESQSPELFEMTRRLAERAEIPMPKLFIVPDPSPNAFATGRSPKHGVVAVNQGLLNLLNRDEVEGVVAHEIAHIKHRDTLTSTIAASLAGAVSSLANLAFFAQFFGGSDDEGNNPIAMLFIMLIAPLAATIIQLAVSRAREYEADKTAAMLIGRGDGLQSALLKLQRGAAAIPSQSLTPSTSHMAIVNPLSGGGFTKLFSTHPPIEDRVRRLDQVNARLRGAA